MGDQVLFHAVREDVGEPRYLSGLLVADWDGLIAARPDLVTPVSEASDLLGELGFEVADEGGQLSGIVDRDEQVVVLCGASDYVELGAAWSQRAAGAGDELYIIWMPCGAMISRKGGHHEREAKAPDLDT